MCSIYGFLDTSNRVSHSTLERLIRNLSVEAEIRGTDAAGISYVHNGFIKTYKDAKPAHEMKLSFPEGTKAVIGHTRMTTQGSETKNWNNHPFDGSCGSTEFALAHNGVIYNDKSLRSKLSLPPTCIETDSYIAVQLLERYEKLDMENIKLMSEAISGSFMITILRNDNTLFLTKGSNPITLYHFPDLGLFAYASTKGILDNALKKTKIDASYIEIKITDGEIMEIAPNGIMTRMDFTENYSSYYNYYSKYGCYSYGGYYSKGSSANKSYAWSLDDEETETATETTSTLYEYGAMFGVTKHEIDILLEYGYDSDFIEEMFYDRSFLNMGLAEARRCLANV